ncbi:MAG: prefoldin subunit alpha [Nanoarchaeota archaeon]
MEQELIEQARQKYEQSRMIEEQLAQVSEQLGNLELFKENINKFESSNDKEIFASLGRGVFFSAEIKDKEFLVDVGAGILVRKNASQAKEIVDNQIKRLGEIGENLRNMLDNLAQELEEFAREIVKARDPQEHI